MPYTTNFLHIFTNLECSSCTDSIEIVGFAFHLWPHRGVPPCHGGGITKTR